MRTSPILPGCPTAMIPELHRGLVCVNTVPFIYGFFLPADVGEKRKSYGYIIAYRVAGQLAGDPGTD